MNLTTKFKVICTQCGEEHNTEQVRVVNVEEDYMGRDVAFFECPITGQITKSLVYGEQ